MRQAESVTFGGSGFDRAGVLRADPLALTTALGLAGTRVMALWRGKLLHDAGGPVFLPPGHPVLSPQMPLVLLGRDADGAILASAVADWIGAETPPSGFGDATEQRHPLIGGAAAFRELRGLMTGLSPRDAELAATARAVLGWHATHGFCAACGAPTVPANAGWQRACATCSASHFPRTDPVVIMLVTRGDRLLLGRSPGWPEGMYSLLAGFIEPGETVEAAVRREVFEEAGIRVGAVGYLASQPWPFPASLMIGCRGEALDDAITIDPVEIEDAIWMPRADVALALAGSHPVVRKPREGAIAHFLIRAWLADRLD